MNLEELVTDERLAKMKAAASERTSSLTLLFDELHHPHNISAVIRSADAFGISDLHLLCSRSELSKGITMGTEKWVRLWCYESWEQAVENLKSKGFKLLLASAEGSTSTETCISDLSFSEKTCLVFGSEKRGPRKELQDATTGSVYVKMKGFVESLNVSVAAAACMYQATLAAEQPPAKISAGEQIGLIKYWLEAEARKKGINPDTLPYRLRL